MKPRRHTSSSYSNALIMGSAWAVLALSAAGENVPAPKEEKKPVPCLDECGNPIAGSDCSEVASLFWAMKVGHAHYPRSEDYNMLYRGATQQGADRRTAQGTGGGGGSSGGAAGGGAGGSGGGGDSVRGGAKPYAGNLGAFGRNKNAARGGTNELDSMMADYIDRDPLGVDAVMLQLIEGSRETKEGFQVKGNGNYSLCREDNTPSGGIAVDGNGNQVPFVLWGRLLQVVSLTAFADIQYFSPNSDSEAHIRLWPRTTQRDNPTSTPQAVPPPSEEPIQEVILKKESDTVSSITSIERFGLSGEHISYEKRTVNGEVITVTKHEAHRDDEGEIVVGNVIRKETITHSNRGEKIWDYTVERVIEEAPTNAGGVMGSNLIKVAHTKEVYGDYSEFKVFGVLPKPNPTEPQAPYVFTGGRDNGRRLESITHDFGGKNLTTTYDYETTDKKGIIGRLNWVQNPDGSWFKNEYIGDKMSPTSAVVSYESWKDETFANFKNGIRSETTVDRDSVTKTVTIGGQVVAKTEGSKRVDPISPKITFNLNRFTGEQSLGSVRTFFAENTVNGGRPETIRHEDGTLTIYSYTDPSKSESGWFEVAEMTGAPSQDGKSVVSGTQTTTWYNGWFQEVAVVEEDIASGLETSSRHADLQAGLDGLMRPSKWIYNGNDQDFTIEQRTCCGIDFERDRTGATKQYFYDALKRPYKIVSKASSTAPEVTTTIEYNGLTTTTRRKATVNNVEVTLLVEEVTKNIAGEIVERKTPDQNGDGVPEVTSYNTEYPGEGTVHTTTFPDGSTKIVTTYRDGQVKSITGTAVPDEFYDHGTHSEQGGGLWTKVTQTNGTEWVKAYRDALDREIRKEYPDGATERKSYHLAGAPVGSAGKLASTADPDEVTVSYGYNAEGEQAIVTEPMPNNQQRVTTVDNDVIDGEALGVSHRERKWINNVLVSSEVSASDGYSSRSEKLGVISSWSQTVPTDGAWTSISISGDGQKVVETFSEGNLVKSEFFDDQHQSVSWTQWAYDAFKRILTETDSRTGTINFSGYNESGKLRSSIDGGGRTTIWGYDAMGRGNLLDQPDTTDAEGNPLANVTHATYYSTGKIKAVWGDQATPTYRIYDERNRLTGLRTYRSLTHGSEPVAGTAGYDLTTWSYHPQRGWLETKRDAANLGADYTYTPAGRFATRQWARTVGGGGRLTTTYAHDAGKLAATTYNDGVTQAVSYTYDAFGRRKQIAQGGNSWVYDYDPSTLLLAQETITYDTDFDGNGDFTRVLSRSHDDLLRPTGYLLKSGGGVETQAAYTYDDAGRLFTVTDGSDIFTYGYEPGSHLPKSVEGPIHAVTNTWDTTRNVLLTKENVVGTSVVSAYSYGVNAIGQRDSVARTSDMGEVLSIGWGRNERGEIVSADNSADVSDRFYQFDSIGNRLKSRTGTATDNGGVVTTYASNALNQYSAIDSTSLSHDMDGNQLTGTLPNAPSHSLGLAWDGENRMIESKNDGTTVGSYRYDPFGRRIYKDGSTTGARWFFYDGWNLLSEHQVTGGTSTVLRTHLWGSDLGGIMQGDGGVGGLLSTNVNELGLSGRYYPAYDGNGNITNYLNASGGIHSYYEYDPFGAVIEFSGGGEFFFRFSTKYEDFETGLNYYGYRYCDPRLGRWTSRDPIGELGGENIYGFIYNNSIDLSDYLGLTEEGRRWMKLLEALDDHRKENGIGEFDDEPDHDAIPPTEKTKKPKNFNYGPLGHYYKGALGFFHKVAWCEVVLVPDPTPPVPVKPAPPEEPVTRPHKPSRPMSPPNSPHPPLPIPPPLK